MRHTTPILSPAGLQLDNSRGLVLQSRGPWIHGVLGVEDEEEAGSAAGWLREIFIIAISEAGTVPHIARICRQDAFLTPPAWEERKLAFTTHSAWIWDTALPPERHFLHAAARDFLSPSIEFMPQTRYERPIEEHIVRAYDMTHRGRHVEALAAFQSALADARVASDLDGAHRYNAACAAARTGDVATARNLIEQDLRARSEAHTRRIVEAALSGNVARHSAIDALLTDHFQILQNDPDLACLK